jgi:chromosome segregation ATPase
MTKSKLQQEQNALIQELLAKVREGIKPSDLKKPKKNLKPQVDDGYESDSSNKSIPTPPPLPNSQIKELKTQVSFWSNTANNHLKNLQLAQAKITSLQEQIQKLKTQKTPPKESELLKDKNHQIEIIALENEKNLAKVNQLNQTIAELKNQAKNPNQNQVKTTENKPETKTFTCAECNQSKPQSELSRVFGSFSFCLDCSKKARHQAQEQKTKPQPLDFTCYLCNKPKTEIPFKMKPDQTLQEYLICLECKPFAKEFNEADLITDELWEKYPYSSASEILEKEFGIFRDKN